MRFRRATALWLLAALAWGLVPLTAAARDRPGTPNAGFAAYCGSQLFEEPVMCVEFKNTASERVGFLMDWTEHGNHMSSDLTGRSDCQSGYAQTYACSALRGWFSGNTGRNPINDSRYTDQREFPEAFKVRGLLWNSEYCFRFRAMDEDGVISAIYSGFTCARTPPAPGAPGALDPPKVTGIAPTSGTGVVGDGTPFKLLVEWQSSPMGSSTTGWYMVQLLSGTQWVDVKKADVKQSNFRADLEAVLEGPMLGQFEDRQAVRVCSVNIVARTCSREGWYYGKLKPKVVTNARQQGSAALIEQPANRPDIAASRSAQARIPVQTATATNATSRSAALAAAVPRTTPAVPPQAAVIYGIAEDGTLHWYRHNGAATGAGANALGAWAPARTVGSGWNAYAKVIPGGGGVIYAITPEGKLIWTKHNAWLTGEGEETPGAWAQPREIASDWGDYKQVICAGQGLIYAIAQNGDLLRFRHLGFADGAPTWKAPIVLDKNWGDYERLFAGGGNGVIYAVATDGTLKWAREVNYPSDAINFYPRRDVGQGWNGQHDIFGAGNGLIYVISPEGLLFWYSHFKWADARQGDPMKPEWAPRSEVGHGWNGFTDVFAQF